MAVSLNVFEKSLTMSFKTWVGDLDLFGNWRGSPNSRLKWVSRRLDDAMVLSASSLSARF